ncbi:MAG: bestrophin family ion channel [Cytophagales bacterium]
MQAGKRYSLWQTLLWQIDSIFIFIVWACVPVSLYYFFDFTWLAIPWQPVSLIGIAVAFYLGFKNNSSYDRLWEARKIWGSMVNTSRSFTVMIRDFISNEFTARPFPENDLIVIRKRMVKRHIAWLYALTSQLREVKDWEHKSKKDQGFRESIGLHDTKKVMAEAEAYLNEEDQKKLKDKKNKASHILSLQSAELKKLRENGLIDDFRHMEMQNLITQMYTEQGQSERIKNFPFPRQYTTANFFFVMIFITLLPFSLLKIFAEMGSVEMVWLTVVFSTLASWVFWVMEVIGDYSENPFEGSYNDVPITSMARGIEIDILQMIDEKDIPEAILPLSKFKILV